MSTHSWAKQSSYISDRGLNLFCIQYAVAEVFSYKNGKDAFAGKPYSSWHSVEVCNGLAEWCSGSACIWDACYSFYGSLFISPNTIVAVLLALNEIRV